MIEQSVLYVLNDQSSILTVVQLNSVVISYQLAQQILLRSSPLFLWKNPWTL